VVNVPDLPPTFGASVSPAEKPWRWRLEDASGSTVELGGDYDLTFHNQADAESWVGEIWAELADLGVDAVTLFEVDRRVYGPMSLHS
jgi:hypothetical protein